MAYIPGGGHLCLLIHLPCLSLLSTPHPTSPPHLDEPPFTLSSIFGANNRKVPSGRLSPARGVYVGGVSPTRKTRAPICSPAPRGFSSVHVEHCAAPYRSLCTTSFRLPRELFRFLGVWRESMDVRILIQRVPNNHPCGLFENRTISGV